MREYRPFVENLTNGSIRPFLPFKIDAVNERKAQESGLRPKA